MPKPVNTTQNITKPVYTTQNLTKPVHTIQIAPHSTTAAVIHQDTTNAQWTITTEISFPQESALEYSPTEWLSPVALATGYNELHLETGLYPHQLSTGLMPKQMEASANGITPKLIEGKDAKLLLAGLQPTKIEPWKVLKRSRKTKIGHICIQHESATKTATVPISSEGTTMIVKKSGKRPTIINFPKKKPMVVNLIRYQSI